MGIAGFLGNRIYAKIDSGNIDIKAIGTDKHYEGPADVAIRNCKVIAFGKDCLNAKGHDSSVSIVNGFKHDRVIVGDFDIAESFVRYMIRWLQPSFAFLRPVAIVHLADEKVEDITTIELKAIVDIFEMAGARKVFVWKGVELVENDIRSSAFYKNGKPGGIFLYPLRLV